MSLLTYIIRKMTLLVNKSSIITKQAMLLKKPTQLFSLFIPNDEQSFFAVTSIGVISTYTLYLPCYPILLRDDLFLRRYQLHSINLSGFMWDVPCISLPFCLSLFSLIFSVLYIYSFLLFFLPPLFVFSIFLLVKWNTRKILVTMKMFLRGI